MEDHSRERIRRSLIHFVADDRPFARGGLVGWLLRGLMALLLCVHFENAVFDASEKSLHRIMHAARRNRRGTHFFAFLFPAGFSGSSWQSRQGNESDNHM